MTVDTSIGVALITSTTGIIIALIGAWASSGKAVATAVEPLRRTIGDQGITIARLREMVIELEGDPDEQD